MWTVSSQNGSANSKNQTCLNWIRRVWTPGSVDESGFNSSNFAAQAAAIDSPSPTQRWLVKPWPWRVQRRPKIATTHQSLPSSLRHATMTGTWTWTHSSGSLVLPGAADLGKNSSESSSRASRMKSGLRRSRRRSTSAIRSWCRACLGLTLSSNRSSLKLETEPCETAWEPPAGQQWFSLTWQTPRPVGVCLKGLLCFAWCWF